MLRSEKFNLQLNLRGAIPTLAIVVVLTIAATPAAQAQKYSVIHSFTGPDGAYPGGTLTMDRAGNLFGATALGGAQDAGEVFKLTRTARGRILTPLYSFAGGSDGDQPNSGIVFGPDGALYGTTYQGGDLGCNQGTGCGSVFRLTPPLTACKSTLCPWTKTVLYRFSGLDGRSPIGGIIFDRASNLYGTTFFGGGTGCGGDGCGEVYKLTRSSGGWTESVLYSFTGGSDGSTTRSGVIFDPAGNLYGTTVMGGVYKTGTVFELTPSGSGWTETVLHSFNYASGDGYFPETGLIFDTSGNLYGTTLNGGSGSSGTVFMLTPSQGSWTETILWNFSGGSEGPWAGLTMDAEGNLYGTTWSTDSVFKLVPMGGRWSETDLYDFQDFLDGGFPAGTLVLDASGNLYGTASTCGQSCLGVVWEILP